VKLRLSVCALVPALVMVLAVAESVMALTGFETSSAGVLGQRASIIMRPSTKT
jgi:hypothetical protein